MGFNYAREKKKFDSEWEKKEKWYRESGMSEDAIREMREYDWNDFKARRCYEKRRDDSGTDIEEIAAPETEQRTSGRYGWIEDIDDSALVHKLRKLKLHELEIITLLIIDDLSREQAAAKMEIPYRTFKYQLKKMAHCKMKLQ